MSYEAVQILLVEDNPGDVRLTEEAVKQSGLSCRLTVGRDGAQSMATLRKQGDYADAPRPDLVLLDLNLPGKDGLEVLADIRTDAELRDIPVVVLTTSSVEDDIEQSLEQDARLYVTKPLDLDQFAPLVESIRNLLVGMGKLPSE